MPALCVTSSKYESLVVPAICAVAHSAATAKSTAPQLSRTARIVFICDRSMVFGDKEVFPFSNLDDLVDSDRFENLNNARGRPTHDQLVDDITLIETEMLPKAVLR